LKYCSLLLPHYSAKDFVIPMVDTFTMRRVAGVVHSLAFELDMLSRRQDLSLRLMALSLKDVVNTANTEIRRITTTDKLTRSRQIGATQPAINASHHR
jgi:hypothetical protein